MLRIVADTNIYVSAILFGGLPEDFMMLAKAAKFKLYISLPIFEEIRKVLVLKFSATDMVIETALRTIRAATHLVQPRPFPEIVIERDPSDDRILECAVAAYANIIISGDRHLRDLNRFENIEIMTIRNFLEYLKLHGLQSN